MAKTLSKNQKQSFSHLALQCASETNQRKKRRCNFQVNWHHMKQEWEQISVKIGTLLGMLNPLEWGPLRVIYPLKSGQTISAKRTLEFVASLFPPGNESRTGCFSFIMMLVWLIAGAQCVTKLQNEICVFCSFQFVSIFESCFSSRSKTCRNYRADKERVI